MIFSEVVRGTCNGNRLMEERGAYFSSARFSVCCLYHVYASSHSMCVA